MMLTSIHGVYRSGKVELKEQPVNVPDETSVIVTFLQSDSIDLQARGMSETEAGELRSRLAMFAEDWDSPEMSIYDDYDTVKGRI